MAHFDELLQNYVGNVSKITSCMLMLVKRVILQTIFIAKSNNFSINNRSANLCLLNIKIVCCDRL